jgi:hypothetical protein
MADRLSHSLINPNQLHAFGTLVKDNPFVSDERVQIPMRLDGTNVVFTTHTPSPKTNWRRAPIYTSRNNVNGTL